MDKLRIDSVLKQLGFTENEIKIYLLCLIEGELSIQKIAKNIGMHRTSTHDIVERMVKSELLVENKVGKRRVILAAHPDIFTEKHKQKLDKLHSMKPGLDHVRELMLNLQNEDTSTANVQHLKGMEGLRKGILRTLDASSTLYVFSNVEALTDCVGKEFMEKYFKERYKKGVHTKLIFPDNSMANNLRKRSIELGIEVRVCEGTEHWMSGIAFWENSVILLNYDPKQPSSTIIENHNLGHVLTGILFPICWNAST